jgi:uncharacterized protein (TIGR03086 family)
LSSSSPPLPTFVIIGAQKSATRWLRSNLGQHPDVFTAPSEVHYFNYHQRVRDLGLDWYRSQFSGWSGEPIVGEATPGYMIWRHNPNAVAKRIKDALPDARLIAILRNPVDRAQSAMLHHIKRGRLPADSRLLDLVRRTPPERDWLCLVTAGWYSAILRPYRWYFGDQLLVMLHDDVNDDPTAAYETAARHIGADTGFVPAGIRDLVFSNRDVETSAHELTRWDRRALFEYFRDDVRKLEGMIGRNLSHWKLQPTPTGRTTLLTKSQLRATNDAAAEWVNGLLAAVDADQLDAPTPCTEWTLRELLHHLVERHYKMATRLRPGQVGMSFRPDVETEPVAAYRAAYRTARAALDIPMHADDEKAADEAARTDAWFTAMVVVHQLAHGWDVAKATGQDATIPDELAEDGIRIARRAFSEIDRSPSSIDTERALPEGANATDRFVAFLGRDPEWMPTVAIDGVPRSS